MGFTFGFGLGWLWGVLTTLLAFGIGCTLKDRREWHVGMDRTLRKMAERKRANDQRVLDAPREAVRDRQDVSWKN